MAIEPGDGIHLPADTRMYSTGSVGLELASRGREFVWPLVPLASGGSLDISRASEPSARYAIKLFTQNVTDGLIEITSRDKNEVLRFSSEALHATHIGLWLNYGAWSGTNTAPYYNAGIEPTTFPHDDLNVASREPRTQLDPGATRQWAFTVSCRLVHNPVTSVK